MISKKIITAVSLGSALGVGGITSSAVSQNQDIQEISELASSKQDTMRGSEQHFNIVNDAEITQDLYIDELLIIRKPSNLFLNEELNRHIKSILSKFNAACKNVDITYVEDSAIYNENLSKAKFIATPHDGHAWVDDTTDSIEFEVDILNIEIDDTISTISTDASMPFSDDFSYPLFLDELSDEGLDQKLQILNLNLDDFSRYFLKHSEYKNVEIKYEENSACYEDSTFKMWVIPKDDHYWENGTRVAYLSTVSLKNIYQKENKNTQFAVVENLASFTKEINVDKLDDVLLNDVLLEIDWNDKNNYPFFTEAILKNVDLSYENHSVAINSNNILITLNAKPINKHVWKNTSDKSSKKYYVRLDNVIVNQQEAETPSIYSKKIFIPSTKQIDLWWHKEFSNDKDILDQIFTEENLWKIFEEVEKEFKGLEVKYWIKNSPKLLSWSQASIDLGVKPKDGYVWDDRQNYERKLNIVVSGFYMNV